MLILLKKPSKNAVTGGASGAGVTGVIGKGAGVTGGVEETKLVPNKGAGTSVKPTGAKGKTSAGSVSDFFDTTSNLYATNKGLIDGIAGAMTPENMASGACFTDLASMGAPEIKVISELMKFTPLGALHCP